MKSRNENHSKNVRGENPWYRCGVATAYVSAIFSLVVLAFLILNYGKSKVVDTEDDIRLLSLKSELQGKPENEALLSQIRTLDLQIRQRRLRAVDRARKGSHLLLGGVIVLLINIAIAGAMKKEPPTPRLGVEGPEQQVHEARFARWAVTAGMVVLGSGALLLTFLPTVDYAGTGAAEALAANDPNRNWPSFRGSEGLGVSAYTNIPSHWDGKTGEGILWKTRVPLPGHSSPIVWGTRIFLTGGDPNELAVFCFDADSGKLVWRGDVTRAPLKDGQEPLEVDENNSWAAPTAVTDGKHVYAIFVTGDIVCFDFNGKKIWQKNLGTPENHYGYASSLAIYQNLVLIQYDQGVADDKMSAMVALDGFTGDVAWRTERPVDCSWTSPIVARIDDQFQIITCSTPWVIAYEPIKGAELWRADCLYGELASSPIVANGLVFAIEPYSKLVAIKADGKGDVTKTHIAWISEEGGPDICSPVSDGQRIFMLGTEGLLSCHKVSDGKKLWEHDLKTMCQASPSLVGKNVYVLSEEEGVMFMIEAGDEYKESGRCALGEKCYASPAFGDGRIYIRGVEHLYCIGNGDSAPAPSPSQYPSQNWPSFRGPEGLGVSAYTNIPNRWDGKTGDGILWKTKVPLPGHNSPIVWGNRIFLSGGDPNEMAVFCFDTASGGLLWRGDVPKAPAKPDEEPLEPMEDTGWAAPTAVTNGRFVCAMFVTGDIVCFDVTGKKLWGKNLGTPENPYGHASSLAIYRNLVLIQYDQGIADEGLSAMIALDGFTGAETWRTKRPVDNSWSSPVVVRMADAFQVLTCSVPWVIAYEPAKGTELWRVDCLAGEMAPSPIYANGLVFVIEPYNKLVAIRPDGRGDVTKTHIAWSVDEGGPDICSPVSDGQRIFMLGTEGLLSCHRTSDGKKLWEHDLREYFLASPSLVGKNLYLLSEKGVMYMIESADEYKELAKCELGEKCHASPAFLDGRIYTRGEEHLYCIGKRD